MSYYISDEDNVLGFDDDVEIGVEVNYKANSASGPSWNEWSGGDPGCSASLDILGWSVDSIVVGKNQIEYKTLSDEMKKKIDVLVENNFDSIEDQIWSHLEG